MSAAIAWNNPIQHRIHKRDMADKAMHSAVYAAMKSKDVDDCIKAICVVKRYLAYQQALINAIGMFPTWQHNEMLALKDYRDALDSLIQDRDTLKEG